MGVSDANLPNKQRASLNPERWLHRTEDREFFHANSLKNRTFVSSIFSNFKKKAVLGHANKMH
jgi:hypothetical protein